MEPHARTVLNPMEERVADDEVVESPSPEAGPAHARPGRSRWWTALTVLGVVVLVAAAGVAGVLVGRQTAPGPDIIVRPEPVVEESTAASPMPVAEVPGPSGEATPLPSPTAPPIAVGITAPAAVPVALTAAPGLSDTSGTATGYRLVNAGISGAQVASVLGRTFGAFGATQERDGTWVVGAPEGPTVTVVDDPLFSWTFVDEPGAASPAPGRQIDPAEAIDLSIEILGDIGVDTTSVDWQVNRYAARTEVIAWQLVAGARTQLSWRLGFTADGDVVDAAGFSAGLEAVPGYPVVGALTAVTRSQSAPWSAITPTPVSGPTLDESAVASPSPSPSATVVGPDKPGLTVPLAEVTVTDAVLGLAQYWQPDGGVLMLPAYEVIGEDGSRWALLAVDEPYVEFVDVAPPTADPAA